MVKEIKELEKIANEIQSIINASFLWGFRIPLQNEIRDALRDARGAALQELGKLIVKREG